MSGCCRQICTICVETRRIHLSHLPKPGCSSNGLCQNLLPQKRTPGGTRTCYNNGLDSKQNGSIYRSRHGNYKTFEWNGRQFWRRLRHTDSWGSNLMSWCNILYYIFNRIEIYTIFFIGWKYILKKYLHTIGSSESSCSRGIFANLYSKYECTP